MWVQQVNKPKKIRSLNVLTPLSYPAASAEEFHFQNMPRASEWTRDGKRVSDQEKKRVKRQREEERKRRGVATLILIGMISNL